MEMLPEDNYMFCVGFARELLAVLEKMESLVHLER